MTIWLYALCGQERDMLPFFLRHYVPEVDRVVLLNGGMDEASLRIAYEYSHTEVHPSPFAKGGYDDKLFVDYAADKYKEARGYADWVIWVDIDEILYTPYSLHDALEQYRSREILAVQCDGYQMTSYHFPYGAWLLTDSVKIGAYDKIYNKMSCFDPRLNVKWSVGRHSCDIDGLCPTPTGMKLLHYRYFGDEWLAARNKRNQSRRSADDIKTGRGYHVAPDYDGGRYSAAWYKEILEAGKEVI